MITAILGAFSGGLSGVIGWVVAFGAGALAIFGVYKVGHSAGTAQANAKQAVKQATVQVAEAQSVAESRVQTMKEAQDVSTHNSSLSADGLADSMREFERSPTGTETSTSSTVQSGDTQTGGHSVRLVSNGDNDTKRDWFNPDRSDK